MNRVMQRMLLGLGLLCGFLAPAPAHADALRLSSLPQSEASVPPSPSDAPKSIPAPERVDGYFVAGIRAAKQRSRPLAVFDNQEAAAAYERAFRGDFDEVDSGSSGNTCFLLPDNSDGRVPPPGSIRDWAASPMTFLSFYGTSNRVSALRAERWVDGKSGGTIEATELWLDHQTGGMRVLRRSTMAFARLARPFPGLEVYATRTGLDLVDIVVRRKLSSEEQSLLRPGLKAYGDREKMTPFQAQRLSQLQHLRQMIGEVLEIDQASTGSSAESECGHFRMRLKVHTERRAPAASSDTAEDALFAEPEEAQIARRDNATFTTSAVFAVQRELTRHQAELLGLSPAEQARLATGLRVRPVAIHVGISRLSADPEPVVSLSYRWNDKARTMSLVPFF